jgi:D-alanine-D-alanine ligase
MRTLILYNLARTLRKGVPSDLICEREVEIIVPLIENVLREAGHRVESRPVDWSIFSHLVEQRSSIDLVFNLAEGFGGANADEPFVPAMLEALGIPFTGASASNMHLTLDKEKTKLVLKGYGLSVPDYGIVRSVGEPIARPFDFPIIVKPIREEASVGIYADSVVMDDRSLEMKCRHVITTYRQPAIFEPFVVGREISVGVIGNFPRFVVFPPLEFRFPNATKPELAFRSYEYKWGGEKEVMVRADLPEELGQLLAQQAQVAFLATECRDYARIDFRIDANNKAYALEVNYNPGIGPNTHGLNNTLTMMASFNGMDFPELIVTIAEHALQRSR